MPTALLCSNDLLALSVMSAVRGLGLDIPGDVSVVGFDGIAIGGLVTPALATVCTPTEAMGAAAMHRLLRLIAGDSLLPGIDLLPHRVRAGESWSSPRYAPTPLVVLPRSPSLPSGEHHA
jgi:DNA-binding LacI/PurR family transcriptional regulator